MVRLIRRFLFGTLALIIVVAGICGYIAWASLPTYSGSLALDGLESPVTITRDEFAVPYIEAENTKDLYFAVGFAHAQDRLWQMEVARRVGQGRIAEVLGSQGVDIDRFMRTLGLYRKAELAWGSLSEDSKTHLQAYADGINAFLDDPGGPLPPEFWFLWHTPEPWKPADSLVWIKMMALDLSSNWRDEVTRARLLSVVSEDQLRDLWPNQPDGSLPSIRGSLDKLNDVASLKWLKGFEGLGSNIWMVSGSKTVSGDPILANDPHLTLRAPSVWYLASLSAPGIDVMGATMPSLPFVIIGQNEHIAWGFTNSNADVQDLFVEQIDPEDDLRYLTPDGSESFEVREEKIHVRWGKDIDLELRSTRHGPIVSELPAFAGLTEDDQVLALQWTALRDEDRTADAGFDLATAVDWQSFSAALENFDALPQNAGFTANDGTIALRLVGDIPIRRAGMGWLPLPGWTGDHDWIDFIPFVGLPSTVNPASGTIVNANNKLVDASYPHFLTSEWRPADRARRIQYLLESNKSDLASTMAMQNDIYSTLAEDFRPWWLSASGVMPEVEEAMAGWDLVMRTDAAEPLIFVAWYATFVEAIFADELGRGFELYEGIRADAMRHVLQNVPHWCDDISSSELVESCDERAQEAFQAAWADLQAAYGDNWQSWQWGPVSEATMEHRPFSRVPILGSLFSISSEKGGDSSSINVARYRSSAPFHTASAPSLRMIADSSEPYTANLVVAAGQSGHPLSSHYRDLTALWREGRYHALDKSGPPSNSDLQTLSLRP